MSGWFVLVKIWAVCALVVTVPAVASAHAFLNAAQPPDGSTVTSPPSTVRLAFTEPVEVRFSTFKVYRLDSDPSVGLQKLNAVADSLVAEVLQRRGDEAQRADSGLATTLRTSTDITIKLLPNPRPGAYVVMWRVLSVDTHTTQGFFVFILAAEG